MSILNANIYSHPQEMIPFPTTGLAIEIINLLRRATREDAEVHHLFGFLVIAQRGEDLPFSVLEFGRAINISDAAASRVVALLGRGMRGRPGAGLIETREDPDNYSRKQIFLTAKGRHLLKQIEEACVAYAKQSAGGNREGH